MNSMGVAGTQPGKGQQANTWCSREEQTYRGKGTEQLGKNPPEWKITTASQRGVMKTSFQTDSSENERQFIVPLWLFSKARDTRHPFQSVLLGKIS